MVGVIMPPKGSFHLQTVGLVSNPSVAFVMLTEFVEETESFVKKSNLLSEDWGSLSNISGK